MPTPRKSRRFGGSASHQKAMMANLAASLFAAEAIVTTEAKAKALRPIAEKLVTRAREDSVHNRRKVVAFLRDDEMTAKLFEDIGPRYEERPVATPASSSWAPATGTTPPWPASNWSDQNGVGTS